MSRRQSGHHPERELEADDGDGASSINPNEQANNPYAQPRQHYTYNQTLENHIKKKTVYGLAEHDGNGAPANADDHSSYELETDADEQLSYYHRTFNITDNMDYKPRKPVEQVVEQDEGPKPTYKSWK